MKSIVTFFKYAELSLDYLGFKQRCFGGKTHITLGKIHIFREKPVKICRSLNERCGIFVNI